MPTCVLSIRTAGQGATDAYTVTYSTTGGANFFGIVGADFSTKSSYDSTNEWSKTINNGKTQSASVTIYGPLEKDGYSGPTAFTEWKDNVYGTFMFYGPPD